MLKKNVTVAAVGVLILGNLMHLAKNGELFTKKVDRDSLENAYRQSQYQKPNSVVWMDDPELFTLAGIRYIHGEDPSSINFEHQPLSKYIFGVATSVFGNPLPAQIVAGTLALILYFYCGTLLFKNRFTALVPVFLLNIDGLFLEQLKKVYLDLIQLTLLLTFFILLYHSTQGKKQRNTMIVLGLFALNKSFLIGSLAFLAGLVFFWFVNPSHILTYVKNLSWSLITYLGGYSVFFLYHQPLDFLRLHLKIIRLYRSYVPEYPKSELVRLIFTGKQRRWFGDFSLMATPAWSIMWPTSAIVGLASIRTLLRSKNKFALLLYIWVILYLIALSSRLIFPRYFLLLFPPLYLLAVYEIENIVQNIRCVRLGSKKQVQ